ncbi:MAG TPA: efflux RND transporter permease subunit [Bryobacteraceae bacterium]|nr:efflux RND transporter permease subunit [Bryobacteraceae bacterium]
MNISEHFIHRPIATSLLMAAIALFGVIAYRALPVSDMPQVEYPTINVSASLPGANPDTMASAVATPLERQFTTISGLDSMISTSSQGNSNITLQFNLNRDIDGATVDVETAIAEAMPLLPPGMPTPPSFHKSNPQAFGILSIFLTSPTMRMSDLDEYAETMMAQRISMVSGVAQVQVFGSAKYAVRVQVDPNRLAARQIGLNEVDTALTNWNVNIPTGTLYGPHTAYTIQANGQLLKAWQYRPMIVAYRNGSPVRLGDVANVIDSVQDDKQYSKIYGGEYGKDGTRGVNLQVIAQPGANTIDVVDSIRALMPTFQAEIPPSVHMSLRGDRSKNIREAFKDIQFTMAATLALVILVIFLFLRNFSATMIPAMALPFSIVGTFAVMYLLDFSMNNISMMALILSVGFVVDDAIVMLENIVRHIELGKSPMQAALTGSREIGFTIVSMTLSLAAVFIPILFMAGILGRLFREFAVTICTAILISGLVSITLTPMLCSRFLRASHAVTHGIFYRAMEWLFDFTLAIYRVTLRWVLHHRPVMLAIFFAVLGTTVYFYMIVSKGFIPDTDNDTFNIQTEAAQGTSYYQMVRYQDQISRVLVQDPDIDTFNASTGGGFGGASSNTGRFMINLKPRRQRKATVNDIINRLRPKVSNFPGIRAYLTVPAAIRVGGRMSKSSYDFTLFGPDTQQLYSEAQKLERQIARIPGLLEVNTDLQIRNPRVNVVLDRDRAAALNVNYNSVSQTLYDAFGPQLASTIYAPTNQYQVLLEMNPQYQMYTDGLKMLYVRSDSGQLVPLNAVAKLVEDAGPQSIPHSGQLPSVTISFALRPGTSLGDATDAIQEVAKANLPPTITGTFQGTAKVFQDSMQNMSILLIVAIAVVYIVLGVLYESYVHPITILSGLPSAGFGALLTLILFKVDLSIYSFVGLIMLIGIVKKNAIMQIDFALEAERKEHKPPSEAIYEGCLIRFRPIMMTTMAALLGGLPIALGYGAGGESRKPLGMAVVGGLAFSQLMTLYLTPVVYTYLAAIVDWWTAWRARARRTQPKPVAAVGD